MYFSIFWWRLWDLVTVLACFCCCAMVQLSSVTWRLFVWRRASIAPRNIRCSSVVTLSRPWTISLLKITDSLFRYTLPRLWNQLLDSFRQPYQSCLDSLPHSLVTPSLSSSPSQHLLLLHIFAPGSESTVSTNPAHLNKFLVVIG